MSSPLKRLASQTVVYGLSSIVGRFLNYLLVPLFTYYFSPAEYGVVAEFYAYMGFLAVLLVFGFETGYFRFRNDASWDSTVVYSTALRFVALANGTLLLLLVLAQQPIANALQHGNHPEYIWWCATILALDSVGAMGFAQLRAENQALRFATIKVVEILVNVGLCIFFIVICRKAHLADPGSLVSTLWNPAIGVGYVFLCNLAASCVKLALLSRQLRAISQAANRQLLDKMLRYSVPMVLIGMAGVVNEMLDRAIMKYLLPYDMPTNMAQLGIYSACYKLSIVMSLFIQAFRYAAEPFFFSHAKERNAPETYAQVLNYFVIFCVGIFLLVTLYIDLFQYFIGKAFRGGLGIVPILLLANLFLGIYVNLSIWYKLTDRTLLGSYISLAGAGVTIVLLFWWVPLFGYTGAAWATLACYAFMTIASYLLGRKYYPVPYDLKRVLAYLCLGLGLFGLHHLTISHTDMPNWISASFYFGLYAAAAFVADGRRLLKTL